jgi:hypothetical protein
MRCVACGRYRRRGNCCRGALVGLVGLVRNRPVMSLLVRARGVVDRGESLPPLPVPDPALTGPGRADSIGGARAARPGRPQGRGAMDQLHRPSDRRAAPFAERIPRAPARPATRGEHLPSRDTGRRRSAGRRASRTRASAQPSKRLPTLPGAASKQRGSRSVALTARLRAGRSTATRRARFVATVGKKRLGAPDCRRCRRRHRGAQAPPQTSTGPRAAGHRTRAGDHHRHHGPTARGRQLPGRWRHDEHPNDLETAAAGGDPAPPSASRA